MTKPKEWHCFNVTVTIQGKYEASDGVVTVCCLYGEDTTQQGGSLAEDVAKGRLAGMVLNPVGAAVPYWQRTEHPIHPELMLEGPACDDTIGTGDEPGPEHPVP